MVAVILERPSTPEPVDDVTERVDRTAITGERVHTPLVNSSTVVPVPPALPTKTAGPWQQFPVEDANFDHLRCRSNTYPETASHPCTCKRQPKDVSAP